MSTNTQKQALTHRKNEHMHRQASSHAYTPVPKRTCAHVHNTHINTQTLNTYTHTQTGRQPPAGQQAEHSNNLPQATCSSSPQWEEDET